MMRRKLTVREDNRTELLIALLLLTMLTIVAIITRPLTPIDETRYVSVAWEMWLRGDFLVPFKNGLPYSDKPPLMMWMYQAGWAIFGVNEWWPRLVSPLFSAGSLLLTVALAKRLWPDRPGVGGNAALVLASCLLWTIFSTSAMFDVLLAFFSLVGIHGILIAASGRRSGFVWLGIAVGLGVLAKGPVILLQLLPVAALAPWWNPGLRWKRWSGGLLLAVLLGALIALAWAIPAGIAGGAAYQKAIFWGQTANRMVQSFAHRRPLWWYLPLLPVLLFPWFVWPSLWSALRSYVRQLDRGGRFCIAWMLPVFIAFSLISGKQLHYLLPLFPAFGLFAARALHDTGAVRLTVPAALLALVGAALSLISLGLLHLPPGRLQALPLLWPSVAMLLFGMVVLVRGRQGRPVLTLAILGAVFAALLQLAIARPLYAAYDVRPMARAVRQLQDAGHTVAHDGNYHAQYQFFGRLQRPLVMLQGAALHAWLLAHPDAYAVMYVKTAAKLEGIQALAKQPYRGEQAVLLNADNALKLMTIPAVLGAPTRDDSDD
jgi:4-amino-4-deoxy-L-arabinose transferase-like glycosyltransferase